MIHCCPYINLLYILAYIQRTAFISRVFIFIYIKTFTPQPVKTYGSVKLKNILSSSFHLNDLSILATSTVRDAAISTIKHREIRMQTIPQPQRSQPPKLHNKASLYANCGITKFTFPHKYGRLALILRRS